MQPLTLQLTPLHRTHAEVLDCELEVLHHWYGDTPELLEETYGRYADDTVFLSLWSGDRVAAFIRFIRPGRFPLKTVEDIGKPPWGVDGTAAVAAIGVDLTRTWEMATMGVRRHDRSAPARTGLVLSRATVLVARANGVDWTTAIIDEGARRRVAIQGIRMQDIPGTGPREYMGSPACSPIVIHTDWFAASRGGRMEHGLTVPEPSDLLVPGPAAARAGAATR